MLAVKTQLLLALKSSVDKNSKEAIKLMIRSIDQVISKIIAEKNAKLLSEQVSEIDTLDGSFSHIEMWNVKKRLFPRQQELPTAKLDSFLVI